MGPSGREPQTIQTPDQVARVCQQLIDHGLDQVLCTGGVTWLEWDLPHIWDKLAAFFPNHLWCMVFLPIGLLPILLSPWLRRHGSWFALAAATVAPLYIIWVDYGRWNSVQFMLVSLAFMAGRVYDAVSRAWGPATTGIFVASWGRPHHELIAASPLGFGSAAAVTDLGKWVAAGSSAQLEHRRESSSGTMWPESNGEGETEGETETCGSTPSRWIRASHTMTQTLRLLSGWRWGDNPKPPDVEFAVLGEVLDVAGDCSRSAHNGVPLGRSEPPKISS